MELSEAAFLSDGETVEASADFEFVEGARFLALRQGDAAPWLIGCDDGSSLFTVLYSDARGVSRVYSMSLADGLWRLWRDDPGFSQRFEADIVWNGDSISGAGRGATERVVGTRLRRDLPVPDDTPRLTPGCLTRGRAWNRRASPALRFEFRRRWARGLTAPAGGRRPRCCSRLGRERSRRNSQGGTSAVPVRRCLSRLHRPPRRGKRRLAPDFRPAVRCVADPARLTVCLDEERGLSASSLPNPAAAPENSIRSSSPAASALSRRTPCCVGNPRQRTRRDRG